MELIFRYPGIVPFSIYEKNVFYGRDHDIEQLFNLITNNKQVLLYSKSGLASIINVWILIQATCESLKNLCFMRFCSLTKSINITLINKFIKNIVPIKIKIKKNEYDVYSLLNLWGP